MKHDIHPLPDCTAHRFDTGRGVVWAVVYPEPDGVGRLAVYEMSVLKARQEDPTMRDPQVWALPETKAARNHFGVKMVREMLHAVIDSMPEVKRWVYSKRSGAHTGQDVERGCLCRTA